MSSRSEIMSRKIAFILAIIFLNWLSNSLVECSSRTSLSKEKTLIWGPGLQPNIVLPVRYFFIQVVDQSGKKWVMSFHHLVIILLLLLPFFFVPFSSCTRKQSTYQVILLLFNFNHEFWYFKILNLYPPLLFCMFVANVIVI